MPGFEVVTITFSFVLGLGVARILGSVGLALRQRRTQSLHWIPVSVAACIFLAHIQFWFALFNLDRVLPRWSSAFYWPMLLLAVLLFLSGTTVLPSSTQEADESLLADFDSRGKVSLLLLAAYMFLWIPLNIWFDGGDWTGSGVYYNLLVGVVLVVAYQAKRPRLRQVMTGAFCVLQVVGVLFVWATPDVLG